MKKETIDKIENLIKEADSSNSPSDYQIVFDYLKELEEENQKDYLIKYYKGLVCYSYPDFEEFRVKWAVEEFSKALEIKPSDLMSNIYLSYCYFDLGKYSKSNIAFKNILSKGENWESLEEMHQQWRISNLAEMVAISNLKLGRYNSFFTYYMRWKEIFYIFIDIENFYIPEGLITEVADFLKLNGKSLDDDKLISNFRVISLDLIAIIKTILDLEDIYSEEIENLKNWDGHQQSMLSMAYAK